ncbi:MAG: transcription elongation factor GreB [Woeseia sp.]
MGRWRPPAPKSSPYITESGFENLQVELTSLWIRRRDVVRALADAAAEGDRSENAEYIYRKKELGGIDRRIRYLQKRLPALTVVSQFARTDAVYFGATVDLADDAGISHRYRIVGPDEADPEHAAISLDSPVARALLGKTVDDTVVIETPETATTMTVTAIRYPS